MKEKKIISVIQECTIDELSADERKLIQSAIDSTVNSYSPYSGFSVGAAVRLANGEVFVGCNQENVAFGVSICGERTAIFAAGAHYPQVPITDIAIAARNSGGLTSTPITPCGSCRQAMIETEMRSHCRLNILLYGQSTIYKIEGIANLMPLSFDKF